MTARSCRALAETSVLSAILEGRSREPADGRPVRATAQGLVLDRRLPPTALPGYAEGLFSVQDGAAQLAAPLLGPAAGQRLLNACAAPGGKTGHLASLAALALS